MDDKNNENVTPRTVKKWGFIAGLLALPVYVFVNHFGGPGRSRAAFVSFALMILAVRAFWYLRRHAWFCIAIAALTIIHIALIVTIHWTNKSFPAPELWPVGIADFAAICGLIKLVEKVMGRGHRAIPTS